MWLTQQGTGVGNQLSGRPTRFVMLTERVLSLREE
jgi:hypothetical protein